MRKRRKIPNGKKKSGATPKGTKEKERREIEEAKGLTVVEGRADAARAELEELVLAGPAAEDLGEVGRDPHPERRRGEVPLLEHAMRSTDEVRAPADCSEVIYLASRYC